MFGYCGNNPISREDYSGHAYCQIDYNYTDVSDILFPEMGASGGGGAFAGSSMILSGLKHSKNEDTQDLYEDCIDLLNARSIKDIAEGAANILDDTIVKAITAPNKMRTGYKMIKKGIGYITATSVTAAGGLAGMCLVIVGSAYGVWGLVETLILGDEYIW